jgi:hypothetical protein
MLSLSGPSDFTAGLYDGLKLGENDNIHTCEKLIDEKWQDNAI